MRIWLLSLPTFILFTGCNVQKAKPQNDELVLFCVANSEQLKPKQDQLGYIIKVANSQRSLLYYSDTEKLFSSNCENKFNICTLEVGDKLVTANAILLKDDGTVMLSRETRINRLTGVMTETLNDYGVLGNRTIFEGVCHPTGAPSEPTPKF